MPTTAAVVPIPAAATQCRFRIGGLVSDVSWLRYCSPNSNLRPTDGVSPHDAETYEDCGDMERFLFPRWINRLLMLVGVLAAGGVVYAGVMAGLLTDPETLNVGYRPQQPVPFSHALHAGQLKMDCRYCHNTVFDSAHAAIPPTATCINCHSPAGEDGTTGLASVHTESAKLAPLHESWESGRSLAWVRVHNLPDYVYFNHSAHVSAGVSCVSCHGRVDQMDVVRQDKHLSMAWCLECHRDPTPHIRPTEFVTALDWAWPEGVDAKAEAEKLISEHNIKPQTDCSICHR